MDQIRKAIELSKGENVEPLLHEMALERGAQMRWNGCVGDGHGIITSWVCNELGNIMLEEDDMGKWVRPTWVELVMPWCDGVVVVMEDCGEANGRAETA